MSAKIIESHVRVNEEVNAYNDAPPSDEHVLDVMTRSAMVIQRFWRTRCKQAEHGNEDSAPSPSISRKPTRSFGANASHNNATGSGALSVESFDPTLRTSANLSEQDLHARLISQYEDLLDHREELLRRNLTIQHKLHQARSFEGSQNVSTATGGGGMSHVIFSSKNNEMIDSETDAKYWNSVRRLHVLGEEYVNKENAQEVEVGLAREKQQATVESAQTVERDFLQLVVEVAKKATFSRNQNKAIPPAVIQDFVTQEEQRSQRLREARIQYIRTRNLNKRLMEEIKDKDKVSSTLHLIDFEQLKIENTTLNEKIEERNEDLLKLRKKSTTTIHILTHVKEKLECVRGENQKLQQELSDLEVQLSERREELSQIKRKRDAFVLENTRMKEKMPMVGADDLLLDFELRKKDIEDRRMEVFHLTNQHKQFSRKIREAENHLNALSFSPVYYAATTAPFVHTYANRNSSGSLKSSSSLSWKPKVPQKGLTSTQARKSSVPGASKLPEDGRDPDPHSGSAISELGVAVRGQASSPSNQRATGSNRSSKH